MIQQVLYIGNNLIQPQSNRSYISILGPLLVKEGVRVHYASSQPNKVVRLIDMLWVTYRLRKKVDLVLIDTYSTLNFYYALVVSQLCRIFGLKYIPILHGGRLPERLDKSPYFSKLIFENSYENVAPSKYLKHQFEQRNFNVKYIPNTLEMSDYTLTDSSFNVPKLLWVRSLASIYNPFLAIETLEVLKHSYQDAQLCMVGPDSQDLKDELEHQAQQHQLNVWFTGKLSKKQWIQLSLDYNIFINTTNVDNMPVSVIEAMALGLPVVSTNVGGMPYLIDHEIDGLLVEPNNPNVLALAIERLMKEPQLRAKLIGNARKKVEQFDWNVIRHQWLKILKP